MNKDVLSYAFYKCSKGEYNTDGSVFVNERMQNFQPLREWDALLAIVMFDKSYIVSPRSNKKCGHLGITDARGKCLECEMIRDAKRAEKERIAAAERETRQRAIAADRERATERGVMIEATRAKLNDLRMRIAELQCEVSDTQHLLRTLTSVTTPLSSDIVAGDNRKHARLIGAAWYHPDTACKYCGSWGLRYVANGRCRDCGSKKGA